MTSSRYSQVTDELLSAYIDEAVSVEERALVEAALAAEPQIAWRLESLRQTVQLLRSLPAIALPRSLPQGFVLSALPAPVVIGQHAEAQPGPGLLPVAQQSTSGWAGLWQGLRSFWSVGSPLLRNAAAVSFALLLVFTAGDYLFVPSPQPLTRQSTMAAANTDEVRVAQQPEQPTAVQPTATNAVAPISDEVGAEPPAANPQAETAPKAADATVQAQSPPPGRSLIMNNGRQAPAQDNIGSSSSLAAPGPDENGLGESAGGEVEPAGLIADSLSKTTKLREATIIAAANEQAAQADAAQPTTMLTGADELQADEITDAQPTAAATPMLAASTEITPVRTTQGAPAALKSAGTTPQDATGWSIVTLLQSVTALLTLLFAALWWRSRRGVDGVLDQ